MVAGREGHASAALGDQIARLGLDDRVRLLGHRSDVAEVLSAADLFVFPSVYEGLGGALIEALALGLPIVASDLPALREVVRPGENADLVSPTDSAALAAAVVALLDDPARRRAYGARSRQAVRRWVRRRPGRRRGGDPARRDRRAAGLSGQSGPGVGSGVLPEGSPSGPFGSSSVGVSPSCMRPTEALIRSLRSDHFLSFSSPRARIRSS